MQESEPSAPGRTCVGRAYRSRGASCLALSAARGAAPGRACAPRRVRDVRMGRPPSRRPRHLQLDADSFLCPAFEKALRVTGVSGRIISPDPREDPGRDAVAARGAGFDPVIVDGRPHGWPGDGRQRGSPGRTSSSGLRRSPTWASTCTTCRRSSSQPREAAYLAGWLAARLEMRRPGPARHRRRRWASDSGGRRLHHRLHRRCEACGSRHHCPRELLERLRRHEQVRGDRKDADRARSRRRVQRGGRLWTRDARGGEAGRGVGHRGRLPTSRSSARSSSRASSSGTTSGS